MNKNNIDNGAAIAALDWRKVHDHKIWNTKDGKHYCTYVYDENQPKHRRLVKRKTLQEVEDYLDSYYNGYKIEKHKTFDDIENARVLEEIKRDFSLYKEINVWGIKKASYLISPAGDIYSVLKHDWKAQMVNDAVGAYKGQKYVLLRLEEGGEKRFSVARLTLAMFVGLPPEDMKDPTVDHIDGDPFNNYYKNLRWLEREYNSTVRKNRGIGEENSRAILTQSDVIHICNLLVKKQIDIHEIAMKYGVSVGAIMGIKQKKTWKYITNLFEF